MAARSGTGADRELVRAFFASEGMLEVTVKQVEALGLDRP
jgi:hypothetical protein